MVSLSCVSICKHQEIHTEAVLLIIENKWLNVLQATLDSDGMTEVGV